MSKAFLVRRKVDGQFYRNGGYRARVKSYVNKVEDHMWTDDPSLCKPFKSTSGAKNAMDGLRQKIEGKEAQTLIKQYVPNAHNGWVKFCHNGSDYEYHGYHDRSWEELYRVVKFVERYQIIEVDVQICVNYEKLK